MDTRWWWIRHAPVPDGGRIYGQRDLDCDCSDVAVFDALARELPHGAVWLTSHLVRTHQTAAAIRAAMPDHSAPSEPRILAELAEQHLGDWQGLDRKEFFARRCTADNPFWFGPASESAPNGESFVDLVERVTGAVQSLSREYAGRNIVAVAHGGTIRAALALALRIEPDDALSCVIDNCSLTRIDRLANGAASHWRVVAINRQLRSHPII